LLVDQYSRQVFAPDLGGCEVSLDADNSIDLPGIPGTRANSVLAYHRADRVFFFAFTLHHMKSPLDSPLAVRSNTKAVSLVKRDGDVNMYTDKRRDKKD
jgi:hypothetical protein